MRACTLSGADYEIVLAHIAQSQTFNEPDQACESNFSHAHQPTTAWRPASWSVQCASKTLKWMLESFSLSQIFATFAAALRY